MLKIGTTVMGVEDIDRAAAFWIGALGYDFRRPPSDDWAILDPPDGQGPSLALSKTRATVHLPPRFHLDLYAEEPEAEIERLVGLGARRIEWDNYPPEADYVILEDTEGNRFCVVDVSS